MTTPSTRTIPIAVRRADPGASLPSDYGVTPHGTIFSTTPGGTRIIYDRKQLLSLRDSPFSQTPPASLQFIPGVTKASVTASSPLAQMQHTNVSIGAVMDHEDEHEEEEEVEEKKTHTTDMFEMDME
jgi:translation initiation factor 4E binding protein 1